jgi:drug/metabolite transporter (DMT)-like permease
MYSIWALNKQYIQNLTYNYQMIKVFPFIFIILWSSAFVTTKPIIDNSDPFAALTFRFFIVALGFLIFSIYTKKKF